MSSKGRDVFGEHLVHAAASATAKQYAEIIELPAFGLVGCLTPTSTAEPTRPNSLRCTRAFARARRSTFSPATRCSIPRLEPDRSVRRCSLTSRAPSVRACDAYFADLCDQLPERTLTVQARDAAGNSATSRVTARVR